RARELRFGGRELRAVLLDGRAEERRIDLGEHVPLFYERVEVDEDLGDAHRDVRADLYPQGARDRSRRLDRFGDAALRVGRPAVQRSLPAARAETAEMSSILRRLRSCGCM